MGWAQHHRFYGGFKRNNVLEYPRPVASKLHPTMKPVDMLQQLIQDGSASGTTVYEPFCRIRLDNHRCGFTRSPLLRPSNSIHSMSTSPSSAGKSSRAAEQSELVPPEETSR